MSFTKEQIHSIMKLFRESDEPNFIKFLNNSEVLNEIDVINDYDDND